MPRKKEEKEPDRVLIVGKPDYDRCDNIVITSRYTALTFLPVAIVEQFRRFANIYFLCVGFIMAIGYYTDLFDSAISPWTTLGPLALVVAFCLLVEGTADLRRHRNDSETNNAPCVILRRADEMDADERAERDSTIIKGKDCVVNLTTYLVNASEAPDRKGCDNNVCVAFQKVRRMDIRQGHLTLVKNREMVPADMILLASSNDRGSAFIETSSIDGETNLKLRTSPALPKNFLKHLRQGTNLDAIPEAPEVDEGEEAPRIDSIEDATKRLSRFSYLGRPNATSALEHPDYTGETSEPLPSKTNGPLHFRRGSKLIPRRPTFGNAEPPSSSLLPDSDLYVSALTTEPPNPSVHTFMGKVTLPPLKVGTAPVDVPLGAENILLRGAVIRNTEWVIGVVCFTGTDTKLVQNSFKTKSKFSQLDRLMNFCVVVILCVMILCIVYLASMAVYTTNDQFDDLWYTGMHKNTSQPWPFLQNLPPPKWSTTSQNWFQYFFLNVTLLNNFVPLSLYVTVEMVTLCMLWFIYNDVEMYDDRTNTRAVARSTIVTDLGQIQYIFSDKTGTLTQNVMRFKRCSVDGLVFGAPIPTSRPDDDNEAEETQQVFHPLRQLLVGQFRTGGQAGLAGLEGLGASVSADYESLSTGQTLTFDAEMFLRVMSLCHTVVVEKDIDKKETIDSGESVSVSSGTSKTQKFMNRMRANTNDSLPRVEEEPGIDVEIRGMAGMESIPALGFPPGLESKTAKGPDGAPAGFAYQAESPDEGALVSAASQTYGFQVKSRDSSGITLRVTSPSHLQSSRITNGLKSGKLSLSRLAADSAQELDASLQATQSAMESAMLREPREETWTILAVNKFDSDRKRMSILLRSPSELGGIPILFCKGADTAMLDPDVCTSSVFPQDGNGTSEPPRPTAITHDDRDVSLLTTVVSEDESDPVVEDEWDDEEGWEMALLLSLQSHLGDFAAEGLRTLVLGMRVLSEAECTAWLKEHKAAATSLQNREELLSKAAANIERQIHIVGATAIEDKLQNKVPETIATLAKAGIKLWVLTGDKRETAVEIGYSTCVLSPKMHLIEVPDNGKLHVRTQMSMEFIRLIKMGKLVEYQKASLRDSERRGLGERFKDCQFFIGKCWRWFYRVVAGMVASVFFMCCCKERAGVIFEDLVEYKATERNKLRSIEIRRKVRARAETQVRKWLESEEGKKLSPMKQADALSSEELSLASEETPGVFSRASSAKLMLNDLRRSGRLSSVQLREISLAQLTLQQSGDEDAPLVDEDALSIDSFFPGNKEDLYGHFDKRKRTMLERLFAIDRDVRKGQLVKHLTRDKLASIAEEEAPSRAGEKPGTSAKEEHGPRALVIEGAALKHLLGDPEMEAILFAVASHCDAVIACRVSPKQKAQLLNLVRINVKPEPITLAIGDGANDVGMIQEAHVGVGISGKEGMQAVNASDFSIAQFRFLEDLLLVHGRWNFFRQSTVVLFSFYKNAIMAGILIVYAPQTLYSGTPLFDQWLIAMLNFVAGLPIIVLGLFDRCLSKDYVKKNPIVYKATRNNELITKRTLARWMILVFVHIFTLYYFTVFQQSVGGGMTSAWKGLMSGKDRMVPGNGEGSDLKSVGTVTFSCMVILLAYKVLYESKALIHGRWPAFTCRKGVGEGFFSRVAYTWHGIIFMSIGFYFFAIGMYSLIGRLGPSSFSAFTNVAYHVLGTRTLSWVLIIFVPFIGIAFDIIGKVFSNLMYPTQTQIHIEIEAKAKATRRRRRLLRASSWTRSEAQRQSGMMTEP